MVVERVDREEGLPLTLLLVLVAIVVRLGGLNMCFWFWN